MRCIHGRRGRLDRTGALGGDSRRRAARERPEASKTALQRRWVSGRAAPATGVGSPTTRARGLGRGTTVPGSRLARRSSRSSRDSAPAGDGSVSGIVALTSASSKDRRGDVVQRMSLCAASNNSITRASSEAVSFSAWIRRPSYASEAMSRRSSDRRRLHEERSRKCARVSLVTLRRSCRLDKR